MVNCLGPLNSPVPVIVDGASLVVENALGRAVAMVRHGVRLNADVVNIKLLVTSHTQLGDVSTYSVCLLDKVGGAHADVRSRAREGLAGLRSPICSLNESNTSVRKV
jgi:hypothetical protein